jgi:hypothetical protein
MKRLRAHLTYANAISTLCLFLLLGGGAAYAATQALPKNSVGPKQLRKGAVTPAKLSRAAKSTLAGPAGERGLQGPRGETGAKGETGETGLRGPSNAYSTFNLGSPSNPRTASLTVPAGNYVVSGAMTAKLEGSNYAIVTCAIEPPAGGSGLGISEVTVPPPPPPSGVSFVQAEVEAAITVESGGAITLTCSKTSGSPTTLNFLAPSLIATRVETLTRS